MELLLRTRPQISSSCVSISGSEKVCWGHDNKIDTPDSKKYIGQHWMLPKGPLKMIIFKAQGENELLDLSFLKVKAKNDAHIGLFTHKKSAADM